MRTELPFGKMTKSRSAGGRLPSNVSMLDSLTVNLNGLGSSR